VTIAVLVSAGGTPYNSPRPKNGRPTVRVKGRTHPTKYSTIRDP